MPYARNRAFTGREAILSALDAALKARRATAMTQAIAGLGGIGKTQTAVEYCYRHRDEYNAVLWARADSAESLHGSIGEIATLLGLPERDAADRDVIREAFKRWLAREPGYLLVLDNADEPDLLPPFLPLDPKGHLLITSRAEDLDRLNLDEVIALPEMPEDEAVAFLFKRSRRRDDDASEHAAAERLAEALGYLPLALEQAAAYIAVNKSSFRDYLRDYERLHLDLLEEQRPVAGGDRETVRVTWMKNLRAVREVSPAAAELLSISAFLAPDRIPYELLVKGASQLGEPLSSALAGVQEDARSLHRLLTPLGRYSLIRRDRTSRAYEIHRLVQAVIRAEMEEETRRSCAERAVRSVNAAFPSIEFSNWPECDRLLPHALACAQWIEAAGMKFAEAAGLLNQAGYYLKQRAEYAVAEPLYLRALAIFETALGPEHPDTATSLNNLAELYRSQGRYTAAEPLHRRALAISETTLGPKHPDTAGSLNNLAELYRSQGRYAEAEPLHRRALTIRETALGPEHPATATSLNNLALLYRSQDQDAAAEPLYRRALTIRETALGPEHPDTATSLINLAELYRGQGQYAAAEPLFRRALAIDEKAYGPDHPEVATDLNNLAVLYNDQGQYAAAEPLYRRALAIRETALGSEHPATATSLNNLAVLLSSQGRHAAAEPLFRRALAIREKALGPDHPATALSCENHAALLDQVGREKEAEAMRDRARDIRSAHARRNTASRSESDLSSG